MNDTTLSQARMLRRLLSAMAAGAPLMIGCGGNVVVDGDGAGGSSTTTTSGSTTTTPTMVFNCNEFLSTTSQPSVSDTCAANTDAFSVNVNCFKPPAGPGSCNGAFAEQCILDTYSCGFIQGGATIECGPVNQADGLCCYTISGDCAIGRPFTIDGHARLGTLTPGDGWGAALAPVTTGETANPPARPDLTSISAETRAALADAWGREALFEHASIASFARFVMQLLAVGAPGDLLEAAQRALADEHAHARICIGLASAYEGRKLAFGALPIDGALGESDAVSIAASLAGEGCVAETVAALQAAAARDEARDPVVKAALARIAEDEAAHAALAWRALAWMLEGGDRAVRAAVERVFREAETHVSIGAITHLPGDASALREHGVLPAELRRSLAREALGRVIGPAATALLQGASRRVEATSEAVA